MQKSDRLTCTGLLIIYDPSITYCSNIELISVVGGIASSVSQAIHTPDRAYLIRLKQNHFMSYVLVEARAGTSGSFGPRLAGRLTADLISHSHQYMSCVKMYEIDLKGNKIAQIENLGATEASRVELILAMRVSSPRSTHHTEPV